MITWTYSQPYNRYRILNTTAIILEAHRTEAGNTTRQIAWQLLRCLMESNRKKRKIAQIISTRNTRISSKNAHSLVLGEVHFLGVRIILSTNLYRNLKVLPNNNERNMCPVRYIALFIIEICIRPCSRQYSTDYAPATGKH